MRELAVSVAAVVTLAWSVSGFGQQPEPAPAAVPAAATADSRFDIAVDNAPARTFFEGLVDGTPYNILVHPAVSGRISLRLKQATLVEVLEATRDMYGYDYRRTSSGFMVLPAAIQSRVFHLSYLDLKRFGVSNTRISSGQVTQSGNNSQYGNTTATTSQQSAPVGQDATGRPLDVTGTSVVTRGDSDFWASIDSDLHNLIGDKPGRSVIINRQSGVIIVHAMPNELRDVSEYLQQTARTVMRQVVLEAKIIEIDLNDAFQAGVNWATVLQRGSSQYTIGQSNPPNGFAGNPLTPTNNPVTIAPGNPISGIVTNTLGGAFTIAADFKDFNTLIELLSSQGRTRVLSSPRVSTLNNQQAIIKAGTDEFFVTNVQSNAVTGTSTLVQQNVQLTPFFSGVALDVTPEVDEEGIVTLHVHPTVSEVSDQTKTLTVQGQSDSIPLALSEIRESDSIVRARSGQLVIIGGLMRQEVTKIAYKTPLLGDIPVLGKAFRSDQNQTQTVELVILLRPIVVADADWAGLIGEPGARMLELNKKAGFDKLDYPTTTNDKALP
jgi:MSHA biogenesis protein MshL